MCPNMRMSQKWHGVSAVSYTHLIEADVDFGALRGALLKLNVDVGTASYWSERMQVQTLDNLFGKGIVPDPVTYLESIPKGYIPNRQKIIEQLKQQQAAGPGAGLEALLGGQGGGAVSYTHLDVYKRQPRGVSGGADGRNGAEICGGLRADAEPAGMGSVDRRRRPRAGQGAGQPYPGAWGRGGPADDQPPAVGHHAGYHEMCIRDRLKGSLSF